MSTLEIPATNYKAASGMYTCMFEYDDGGNPEREFEYHFANVEMISPANYIISKGL